MSGKRGPTGIYSTFFKDITTGIGDEGIGDVIPTGPATSNDLVRPNDTNETEVQPKQDPWWKKHWKTIFGVIFTLLVLALIIYFRVFHNKSSLISQYENKMKSGFSNKDQYEDPNKNDYDINYLVEQMIYKEFSPSDKKIFKFTSSS